MLVQHVFAGRQGGAWQGHEWVLCFSTHHLPVDAAPAQNDADDTASAPLIATALPRQRAAHPKTSAMEPTVKKLAHPVASRLDSSK